MTDTFLYRMIVLANEILEDFFNHGFAQSFQMVEKVVEKQRSLGREIFDSLLATGAKFANGRSQASPNGSGKIPASDGLISSAKSRLSVSSSQPSISSLADSNSDGSIPPIGSDDSRTDTTAPTELTKRTSPVVDGNLEKHAVKEEEEDDDNEIKDKENLFGIDEDDDEDDEAGGDDVLEEVEKLLQQYGDEV